MDIPGQVSCLPCAPASYADVAGSTVCTRCDYGNMVTSPSENTCTCLPGLSFLGTGCETCEIGSFRSQLMADTRYEKCVPCPMNTTESGLGSTYCDCLDLYASKRTDEVKVYLPDEHCVPVTDYDCPFKQYQLAVQCLDCPPYSTTANLTLSPGASRYGLQACDCDPGFGGNTVCTSRIIQNRKGDGTM